MSCSKMKWWTIYTNLPVNAIDRLPHPQSEDSQGQEIFLALSADKQIHNYDTQCSNHHLSLSTLKSKGISHSKMKWAKSLQTTICMTNKLFSMVTCNEDLPPTHEVILQSSVFMRSRHKFNVLYLYLYRTSEHETQMWQGSHLPWVASTHNST